MPTQQTELTSETEGGEGGGEGCDLSVALLNGASTMARPDMSIAAMGTASSAAGSTASSMQRVSSKLKQYWQVFQQWRERRRLLACLSDLSERQLMDIGIASSEIEYIAACRAIDRFRDGSAYMFGAAM